MSADREHDAKVRAMEGVMAGELAEVTRIGPPTLTVVAKVRYESCGVCGGDGYIELRVNRDGIGVCTQCGTCNGKGTVAVEVPA